MVPATYKMVDLDGLDLAEVNGSVVPGIYAKISEAYTTCRIAILCNWKFADIVIAPAHVLITVDEYDNFIINDLIFVGQDDTISLIGVIPDPTLVELTVTENGFYEPEEGVDGFSSVDVDVPDVPAVLETLSVSENGTYYPDEGYEGFSQVVVNVPAPVIENPYIAPAYEGLAYTYPATNGWAYHAPNNVYYDGFFEVTSGKYVIFEGEPVSNRFRALFFAGKTFSDFEQYIDTPSSTAIQIYQSTLNITGGAEIVDDGLLKRIYFTVNEPGVVFFCTSNQSDTVKPYLFKLTN